MSWGRIELEALGRDELLSRARRSGIAHPELMTRLELVEELLRSSTTDDDDRRVARSLLGKARELVARMMDLGLHLPDAAQRLRPATPQPSEQQAPEPLATTALARVYAAQGHRDQALATLDRVLAREPSHQEALRLREQLSAEPAPSPAAGPVGAVPSPALDSPQATLQPRAAHASGPPARDELHLELRAGTLRLSWRVKPSSFARRWATAQNGRLVLRVVQVLPAVPEPLVNTTDTEIDAFSGACDLPFDGAPDTLCAAVGVRTPERFDVIATAG